jgi:hypothetical protein
MRQVIAISKPIAVIEIAVYHILFTVFTIPALHSTPQAIRK